MGKNKDRLNQKSIPWANSILDQVNNLPPAGGEDLTETAADQTAAVEDLLRMVQRKVAENNGEVIEYTYGTADLEDGVTPLAENTFYFVVG